MNRLQPASLCHSLLCGQSSVAYLQKGIADMFITTLSFVETALSFVDDLWKRKPGKII